MAQFEYMICTAQLMHLTFINGQWQGQLPPNANGALETCPQLWEFLQEAGGNGWELITVTSSQKPDDLTTLYLKREKKAWG
jgi:hypothetical protein